MTDQELIDWIKGVKDNDTMPADTNQRMTRLIQILINRTDKEDSRSPATPSKAKRSTLKLKTDSTRDTKVG